MREGQNGIIRITSRHLSSISGVLYLGWIIRVPRSLQQLSNVNFVTDEANIFLNSTCARFARVGLGPKSY